MDPEVTGTTPKVKKTTTGSQKSNRGLPGYWNRKYNVPELQDELKKRGVTLIPARLKGQFKLRKPELVQLIVDIENKGSTVFKKSF